MDSYSVRFYGYSIYNKLWKILYLPREHSIFYTILNVSCHRYP